MIKKVFYFTLLALQHLPVLDRLFFFFFLIMALQLIVNNDGNANQDSSSFGKGLKALYLHII